VNMGGGAAGPVRDVNFTGSEGAGTPGFTYIAPNIIPDWIVPNYGATANDNNLEAVTQSIRYRTNASVLMNLADLTAGRRYKLQLLTGEGACCGSRGFDDLAEGQLIVDNYSTALAQGGEANFASAGGVVTYEFTATDTTLNLELRSSTAPFLDRNPIINAVTLEDLGVPSVGIRSDAGTLTLGGTIDFADADATFSGDANIVANNAIGGSGNVTKAGTGTLTLGGNSTYSGDTTVDGGTLLVNGSTDVASDVIVANTATLGGTGTMGGPVSVTDSATLAPGGQPGTLASGDLSLEDDSIFQVELVDLTGPGSGHDQQVVTGEIDIQPDVTLDVVDTISVAIPEGRMFVVIDNDTDADAVDGTFSGLANGDEFVENGHNWRIYYTGGDGNDVILVNAPTPTTVYADDDWADFSPGQFIQDADPVLGGDQNAEFGYNAFRVVNHAIGAVDVAGTVIVNAGTYAAVDVNKSVTMNLQEAGITFDSLAGNVAATVVSLNGITLTTGVGTGTQYDGTITGTGNLTKTGGGTFTLTNANTYSGLTNVNTGTLDVDGEIGSGGPAQTLAVAAGATLTGRGPINAPIDGAAGSIIIPDGDLTMGDGSGAGFATEGILQVDTGLTVTLVDSGLAVLGSDTSVAASGTLAAANGVSMSSAEQLSGAGEIAGQVRVNSGTVLPGDGGGQNQPGTLTTGAITFGTNGTYDVEVLGAGHDQLAVNGSVDLGGSPGATLDVDFNWATAGNGPFVIIDNDGNEAVTGIFKDPLGSQLPDGSTLLSNGTPMQIEYDFDSAAADIAGGIDAGNDVALFIDRNPEIHTGDGPNDILVRTDTTGALLQLFIDDPGVDVSIGSLTPSGSPDLEVAVGFLESLTIYTEGGDDHLAVDYSNGVFALSHTGGHVPFTFDFGTEDTGDLLVLTGGDVADPDFAAELYAAGTFAPGSDPFNPLEGSVELTAVNTGLVHEIDFTGLEQPIDDSVPLVDTLTVTATTAADTIGLADAAAGYNRISVSDATNTYTSLDLSNKPNLVINGGDEADTVNVEFTAAATGLSTATINGETGSDTFNINASTPAAVTTDLNGNAGDDQFVFAAGSFVLTGSIDGGTENDTLDYSNYGSARTLQLTWTGSVDGFRGNDASAAPSLSPVAADSFDNIDVLQGSGAGDTLIGPNQDNHWDVGGNVSGFGLAASPTDAGVLITPAADVALTGNDTRIGQPEDKPTINYPNPFAPGAGEQDLAFAGFANLVGGSADDWFDLRDGAALTGTVDGADGNDSLDYRDYTTSVNVDLSTGTATNVNGGAAGGLLPGGGGGSDGNSIENAFGGEANDVITGDTDDNILGDGLGSDILNGGSGDDTFRIEPGSDDYILDPGGNDTVDFRFADDGTDSGIVIDMDVLAWDADGIVELGTNPTVDIPNPQTVLGSNTVSLVAVGEPQKAPAPSPFENIVGSQFDDLIEIDPLPTVRAVDGNDGWEPLYFDGGDSEVTDTGRSLTAAGIGSIVYANIELVETFNTSPRIIDNDDPGYSQDGTWGRSRSEGYLGDERSAAPGIGNKVARWTFAGVTPGWYRVAATWVHGPNRATNAQYRVLDGAAAAGTYVWDEANGVVPAAAGVAAIDQQAPPSDFLASGGPWQELSEATAPDKPLYFWMDGHTLTVELPDTGDAYVMADAVRIERLNGVDLPARGVALEPEIRLLSQPDARNLIDGFGVENFGTTDQGTEVVHTYLVQNTGLAPLNVQVLHNVEYNGVHYYVPTGYSATFNNPADPTTASLAPGENATLTVTLLETNGGGVYSGTLFLGNDDRDEDPFGVTLTGVVRSDAPIPSTGAVMVDNDDDPDTFFLTDGSFRYQRRDTQYVDADYRYAPDGTNPGGTNAVRYKLVFETTTDDRSIELGATWLGVANNASNALYRVYDSGDGLLAETRVSQRLSPNDFEDAGIMWESLGHVTLAGGQSDLWVEISTEGANGYVIADAVWGGLSTTPDIAVRNNHSGENLTSGLSVVDLGYVELTPTASQQLTRTFRVSNSGGVPLNLVEPVSLPLGFSLVTSFGDMQLDPGEGTDFEVRINAAAPGELNGKVSIWSDDPDENPFEFVLQAQVGVKIVDNDNADFESGLGSNPFRLAADPLHVGGDFRYHSAGTGANYVEYEFTGLTEDKYYSVAATWIGGLSGATNAPYEVYAGVNPTPPGVANPDTPLTTVRVNQNAHPNDFTDSGSSWEQLAIVQVPSGGSSLTVRLTDHADSWVYADAVRIEQVYLPTLHVTVGGQLLKSGETIDLGRLLKGSAGEERITVANAGLLPLDVNNLTLPSTPGIDVTLTGYGDGVLETGESFTIDVDLDTSPDTGLAPGPYEWDIAFDTNDVSAFAYEFTVEARVVDRLIVNDGDAAFRLGPGSDFGYLPSTTLYYGSDVHYHAAGVVGAPKTVEWVFQGLAAGTYDVSATWVGHANRATDAPYRALDGNGTVLLMGPAGSQGPAEVDINQEPNPDDFESGGAWWEVIFEEVSVPDEGNGTGTLVIELSDQANQYVIADAMMVQFVAPPGQGLRAESFGDSAGTNELRERDLAAAWSEAAALWQSTGLTPVEQARLSTVDVQVVDLSSNVLGWTTADATTVWIDTDAAGYGWTVSQELRAESGEPDVGGMDLLTVLTHELGHVIGREHSDDHDVMSSSLDAGVRLTSGIAHQTTRLPDHQTLFRGQESGGRSQESGLWSAFADHGSPLHIPHSALRIPHSSGSPLVNAVFAELDDRTGVIDDERSSDSDQWVDETEDGLDLWSVLHGLDS
jgi:autotransporter-associated beta strand protein